jgi:hypothetical protein
LRSLFERTLGKAENTLDTQFFVGLNKERDFGLSYILKGGRQ